MPSATICQPLRALRQDDVPQLRHPDDFFRLREQQDGRVRDARGPVGLLEVSKGRVGFFGLRRSRLDPVVLPVGASMRR